MFTAIFLLVIVLFLAYSNGANDNFKGVATLYSCGVTNYRKALIWSSIMTMAGVLCSVVFAETMMKNFSGKGLVPDEVVVSDIFILSVSFASGLTVLLASKIGMPISTTHGIIGALLGSGMIANSTEVNFMKLGEVFLLPLLLSPIISIVISYVIIYFSKNVLFSKQFKIIHFITSGAVCFTRGLNDAPKIAGMLVIINLVPTQLNLVMIGIVMVVGGLIQSKKVAKTMSKKLAKLNDKEGIFASGITAVLVGSASVFGLPVSTTHISVGSIYGASLVKNKQDNIIFKEIVLSWVLTLPIALILGVLSYSLFRIFM